MKKGLKLLCIVLPWFTAGIGFNPILDRIFKAIKAHEGLHNKNDGWHDFEEYSWVVYKRSTDIFYTFNKKE